MSARWVLSAAHCFDQKESVRAIVAAAGMIDRRNPSHVSYAFEVFLHHFYGGAGTLKYDVALLKVRIMPPGRFWRMLTISITLIGIAYGSLRDEGDNILFCSLQVEDPFPLNEFIKPVKLPTQPEDVITGEVTYSGFGQ